MTEPQPTDVPDVGPDEELASALVDGEATAVEQVRADAPEVTAAVDAYTEVARLVRTPVAPASEAARETAIAAALAAFDRGESDAPMTAGDELAGHRARRSRRPEWLGAVAAALVILAGLGLLAGLSGRGGDDDETAATSADTEDTTAAPSAGGEGGTESADSTIAPADSSRSLDTEAAEDAASTTLFLGDFDDVDALLDAVRAEQAARQSTVPSTTVAPTDAAGPEPMPCGEAAAADLTVDDVATATLAGAPVVVATGIDPDQRPVVVVFDAATCSVLTTSTLEP